jgi:CBS domain containing-hemolysin-like protein
MNNLFLILVALFLVVLNGFFVAAEFGLVKLRQTRLRAIIEKHGWRGRILAKVHGKLDAYLSACQLGITLASLGLGWVGEPAFASVLEPLLIKMAMTSPELLHGISFAIAFSAISFLHIVVGELAPKSLAIRSSEAIALLAAVPLYGFYWLMFPAIWVLNNSANLVLYVMGLSGSHGHDASYSAEELKFILRSNRASERFNRDEWNILAKTLDFSELEVSDLMRPLHEVTALYQAKPLEENLATVYKTRFSRYPYFAANGIDVLGVIHLKDLFLAQQQLQVIDNLEKYLRPIQYVSPQTPAMELVRHFRTGASHFTMIGWQGEKPQGFITLDNLLSAIVGEIRDEFRHNNNDWARFDDGTLFVKGSLPIFSLERILGIDIENEALDLEDTASLGGLIMAKLGDIPVQDQKIAFNQFEVLVKKMDGPRVVFVQIFPNMSLNANTGN